MRAKDIVIGNYYRHKDTPEYDTNRPYAKPIRIYQARKFDKTKNYIIVECEWTLYKNDNGCFILLKYFRPRDLVEAKDER